MKTTLFILSFLGIMVLSTAQIIHVPASQPTIQAGIDAASEGDTVLVEDGTYLENINFNGKAITVASHFLMDGDTNHINNTIIDGSQPQNPDLGSVVTFISGEDTTSVISGFTITGGTGLNTPGDDDWLGGGIVCFFAGAKIVHNKIVNNSVTSVTNAVGGGIGCFNDTGDRWIILENNDIFGNACHASNDFAAGGGLYITSNTRIRSNYIRNNQSSCEFSRAQGGGLFIISPDGFPVEVSVYDNVIRENTINAWNAAVGGGLFIRDAANIELINNQIINNIIHLNTSSNWYGAGGWIILPKGHVTIKDNVFATNSGLPEGWGRGGGLCLRDAMENNVTVDANRFYDNHCFRGGGIYSQGCYNLFITNNIFSFNTGIHNNEGRGGAVVIYNPSDLDEQSSISLDETRTLMVNNTFCSNTADYQGGAIHYQGSLSPLVTFNNIFWENDAPTGKDINSLTSETIVVTYSDLDTNAINGLWVGEGNINVDPYFQEGDTLYHLNGGSPCQDIGVESIEVDGAIYYCPDHDYEGDPRPASWGGPDIGADEHFYVGEEDLQLESCSLQLFPNPSSGAARLRFTLHASRFKVIDVYSLSGQKIKNLLSEEKMPGTYEMEIDVSNLPAGVYFVRMVVEDKVETIKLLLINDH